MKQQRLNFAYYESDDCLYADARVDIMHMYIRYGFYDNAHLSASLWNYFVQQFNMNFSRWWFE